jgi:hypothetical protein
MGAIDFRPLSFMTLPYGTNESRTASARIESSQDFLPSRHGQRAILNRRMSCGVGRFDA